MKFHLTIAGSQKSPYKVMLGHCSVTFTVFPQDNSSSSLTVNQTFQNQQINCACVCATEHQLTLHWSAHPSTLWKKRNTHVRCLSPLVYKRFGSKHTFPFKELQASLFLSLWSYKTSWLLNCAASSLHLLEQQNGNGKT